MKFAELSVRSLLILNGGAALALLAFTANTGGSSAADLLVQYGHAIWCFGLGACLAVFVAGLAYLSQTLMAEAAHGTTWNRVGQYLRVAAAMAWLTSLTLFASGIWIASAALNAIAA